MYFIRIKVLYPKINMNEINKYYKPKSISTHNAQKSTNVTPFTDFEISQNNVTTNTNKNTANYTYCSNAVTKISETKKTEDFKAFYEHLLEKCNNYEKEKEEKQNENNKNEGNNVEKIFPLKNENIKNQILVSRMKKYKAIIDNEKIPTSNYLDNNNISKMKQEPVNDHKTDQKIKQNLSNPMRLRKVRLLY